MLTAKLIRERFDYNPDTGEFFWKKPTNWKIKIGTKAGFIDIDHYKIKIYKKQYMAHRIAWLHYYGEWPKEHLDHIDGNGLNNAISNLRECNMTQNSANRKKHRNNKSGYKGVSLKSHSKKWAAQICHSRKVYHLGYFDNPEEAHEAYKTAANKIFGDFARYE